MREKWRLFAGTLCLVVASSACSRTNAVLVGVSSYPHLPRFKQLTGPRNDVILMRQALLDLGVEAQDVQILADGVAESASNPTTKAIVEAIASAGRSAVSGDWVIVYLSGHGSQQPAKNQSSGYQEADGLDEVFLAADATAWDARRGAISGAIVDDEFAAFFSQMTSRGVNVWAIFDACHAGDMAKAVPSKDGPKTRFVQPSLLKVPAPVDASRVRRQIAAISPNASRSQAEHTGRLVVFYASQPDEPAAEERLPELGRGAIKGASLKYYGLFTYTLAGALHSWKGPFSDLAQTIGDTYRLRPYPRPYFEGPLQVVPDFSIKADRRP